MTLTPGTRFGVYDITAQIGEGGMGQVFRAMDTKLKRQVAIKIVPPSLAADHDRLVRFQREAEVLASLNHPNISHIHGLEETEGITALVMELVEGEDLSQRIARGAIPLDEALPIARQIADALEAAHEQGIIHRDLKPANIKLRADGTVKVLDFGLAKAVEAGGTRRENLSMSPTMMSPAQVSGIGVILGTAAYMAPEQARGQTLDKRADIWAFGVVFYEMLTGRRAFDGPDMSILLACVLKGEVRWDALPSDTPDSLRRLLRRCLEKDPRRRLADIGDARLEIAEAVEAKPGTGGSHRAALERPTRERAWQLIAAALTVIAAGAMWWGWSRGARSDSARPAGFPRFDVNLGADIPIDSTGPAVILSPDGTRLVFLSQESAGRTHLFVKRLDQPQATELLGTDGAYGAFFSPDSQWVGFFAAGKLRKIGIDGGQLVTLCDAAAGRGASWSDDGTFIVADLDTSGPLSRIPAEGGVPVAVTKLEGTERSHRWPQILPGGKAVLFLVNYSPANYSEDSFAVVSLSESGSTILAHRIILDHAGLYPRYLSSGHLVFVKKTTLYAVPFDVSQLTVHGVPTAVIEDVSSDPRFGFSQLDVSRSGALAYHQGGASGLTTMQWLDGSGHTETLLAEPASYTLPKVSPDGERIAFSANEGPRTDIWIHDWRTGTHTRLTEGPGVKSYPVWSPDGAWLVYGAPGGIFWTTADAAQKPRLLLRSQGNAALPSSFSRSGDGVRLAFTEQINNRWSIKTVAIRRGSSGAEAGPAEPFVDLQGGIGWPAFSADGRWLAYSAGESGLYEVYVRAFPDKGTKRLISSGGGVMPIWSHNGTELFYRTEDQRIMVVSYAVKGESFVADTPRVWSARRLANTGLTANLDLALDGRFAVLMPAEAAEPRETRGHVTLVPDFFDELRRRVPLGK